MADLEAGGVTVFTGDGKGKTTSALGESLCFWGEGKRVLVLQFIKGKSVYGEYLAAERMAPGLTIKKLGLGFVRFATGETLKKHIEAAGAALEAARDSIASGEYQLVVLDEILYCVKFGLLQETDILDLIKVKPPGTTLFITGRGAPPAVMDCADRVIEAVKVKHPITRGVRAQKGIEY